MEGAQEMNLIDAWNQAEYGDWLVMRESGIYPFRREKKAYGYEQTSEGGRYNLGSFIHIELGDVILNVLRPDWEVEVDATKLSILTIERALSNKSIALENRRDEILALVAHVKDLMIEVAALAVRMGGFEK